MQTGFCLKPLVVSFPILALSISLSAYNPQLALNIMESYENVFFPTNMRFTWSFINSYFFWSHCCLCSSIIFSLWYEFRHRLQIYLYSRLPRNTYFFKWEHNDFCKLTNQHNSSWFIFTNFKRNQFMFPLILILIKV